MQINQKNEYLHSVSVGGTLAASSSITIKAPAPHAHLILAGVTSGVGVIAYTSDNTLSSSLLATGWGVLPSGTIFDIVCDYVYIFNSNTGSENYVLFFEW